MSEKRRHSVSFFFFNLRPKFNVHVVGPSCHLAERLKYFDITDPNNTTVNKYFGTSKSPTVKNILKLPKVNILVLMLQLVKVWLNVGTLYCWVVYSIILHYSVLIIRICKVTKAVGLM